MEDKSGRWNMGPLGQVQARPTMGLLGQDRDPLWTPWSYVSIGTWALPTMDSMGLLGHARPIIDTIGPWGQVKGTMDTVGPLDRLGPLWPWVYWGRLLWIHLHRYITG